MLACAAVEKEQQRNSVPGKLPLPLSPVSAFSLPYHMWFDEHAGMQRGAGLQGPHRRAQVHTWVHACNTPPPRLQQQAVHFPLWPGYRLQGCGWFQLPPPWPFHVPLAVRPAKDRGLARGPQGPWTALPFFGRNADRLVRPRSRAKRSGLRRSRPPSELEPARGAHTGSNEGPQPRTQVGRPRPSSPQNQPGAWQR